jgi:hypothetical protein
VVSRHQGQIKFSTRYTRLLAKRLERGRFV